MVGRNINTRPTDVTSLYTYPNPVKYIKRLTSKDRGDVVKRIKKEKPVFQNMSQNAIIYSDIYFDAFGDRLKIIYIKRNINDIVDSIMKDNFGNRIGEDPTEVTPTILYKGKSIPYYAIEWKKEYINMTPKERVHRWVEQESELVENAYHKTKYKNNIIFINFESFIKNPTPHIKKISKLLDREPTDKLAAVLKRERCPR